jgi:Zn finger protein HypA/HybF involved in hydrogenase expression
MAKKLTHDTDPQPWEKVTVTASDVGVLDLGQMSPEETVRAIERRCRGPLAEGAQERISTLLANGQMDEARALDATSRQRCGQDWNEVILSHPFDGKSHETSCPKCGTVVRWTAPVF